MDRGKERRTCTNHHIDHIYSLIYEPTGQKVKEVRSYEQRHSVGTYEAGPDGIYLSEDGQHISIVENNGTAVKRYTLEELLELVVS